MRSRTDRSGPTSVAIIGFGLLAERYYVPALSRQYRAFEFFVADPLAVRRAAAHKLFGDIPIYSDHRDLLADQSLDAALVASPPSTHLEIWKALAANGVPVFMEKPFLLPGELDGLDTDDPDWRRLMIDFNRRFWPAYRELGERVADGSLGRIRSARFRLHVDARTWSAASNHRIQPANGGALLDLGSQMLDLVIWTFGRLPDSVRGRRTGNGFDERVVVELEFGEAAVECDVAYGSRRRESVWIEGELATIEHRDPNSFVWVVRKTTLPGKAIRLGADLAAFGFRGIMRGRSMLRRSIQLSLVSFFDQLESSEAFAPGFEDAYRVARCTKAAAASIATGRQVTL